MKVLRDGTSLHPGSRWRQDGCEEDRSYGKDKNRSIPGYQGQIDFLRCINTISQCILKMEDKRREFTAVIIKAVLPVLEAQEAFDNDSLFAALSAFGKMRVQSWLIV